MKRVKNLFSSHSKKFGEDFKEAVPSYSFDPSSLPVIPEQIEFHRLLAISLDWDGCCNSDTPNFIHQLNQLLLSRLNQLNQKHQQNNSALILTIIFVVGSNRQYFEVELSNGFGTSDFACEGVPRIKDRVSKFLKNKSFTNISIKAIEFEPIWLEDFARPTIFGEQPAIGASIENFQNIMKNYHDNAIKYYQHVTDTIQNSMMSPTGRIRQRASRSPTIADSGYKSEIIYDEAQHLEYDETIKKGKTQTYEHLFFKTLDDRFCAKFPERSQAFDYRKQVMSFSSERKELLGYLQVQYLYHLWKKRYAKGIPIEKKSMTYWFFDDRTDILKGLETFFLERKSIRPAHCKLEFFRYAPVLNIKTITPTAVLEPVDIREAESHSLAKLRYVYLNAVGGYYFNHENPYFIGPQRGGQFNQHYNPTTEIEKEMSDKCILEIFADKNLLPQIDRALNLAKTHPAYQKLDEWYQDIGISDSNPSPLKRVRQSIANIKVNPIPIGKID